MSTQYLRKISLKVGNDTEALELSALQIQFEVKNATTQTPKNAFIKVFNLAPETSLKIQKEFTDVELSAGYQSNCALIFKGSIYQLERGREGPDSYLILQAQDGDKAYNWATSNWSLERGYTKDDKLKKFLQDLAPFGITMGYKPVFPATPSIDAYPCFGQTRDHLRLLAQDLGCDWNIENGQLNFLPKKSAYPGAMAVITPSSGLIGTPRQTIDGITFTSLLNPLIRAGGMVQLDNSDLATTQLRYPATAAQAGAVVAGMDPRGIYKSLQVIHEGDSRGNTYYTHAVCVALDGTMPNNQSLLNEVPDV